MNLLYNLRLTYPNGQRLLLLDNPVTRDRAEGIQRSVEAGHRRAGLTGITVTLVTA